MTSKNDERPQRAIGANAHDLGDLLSMQLALLVQPAQPVILGVTKGQPLTNVAKRLMRYPNVRAPTLGSAMGLARLRTIFEEERQSGDILRDVVSSLRFNVGMILRQFPDQASSIPDLMQLIRDRVQHIDDDTIAYIISTASTGDESQEFMRVEGVFIDGDKTLIKNGEIDCNALALAENFATQMAMRPTIWTDGDVNAMYAKIKAHQDKLPGIEVCSKKDCEGLKVLIGDRNGMGNGRIRAEHWVNF